MSTYHQIFVATGQPTTALLADLAAVAGRDPAPVEDGPVDFAVGVGRDAVEVELSHDFEEDYGIPFERYPVVVTVRDYDQDLVRQEEVARQVFDHLAATGRYALVLVFDLRELVDSAPPLR